MTLTPFPSVCLRQSLPLCVMQLYRERLLLVLRFPSRDTINLLLSRLHFFVPITILGHEDRHHDEHNQRNCTPIVTGGMNKHFYNFFLLFLGSVQFNKDIPQNEHSARPAEAIDGLSDDFKEAARDFNHRGITIIYPPSARLPPLL